MGILRRAIAQLLAKHPNVEKFYPAEQNQGGAGATIVEMKARTSAQRNRTIPMRRRTRPDNHQ
jgi:DNA-nicking Smr family endonuclease